MTHIFKGATNSRRPVVVITAYCLHVYFIPFYFHYYLNAVLLNDNFSKYVHIVKSFDLYLA